MLWIDFLHQQAVAIGSYLSSSSRALKKLDCYCITLDLESCHSRQSTFRASAERYSWDFTFWTGVNGLSNHFTSRYLDSRSPVTGFLPTRPEMACAMSHLAVLNHFLEGEHEYRLVCEDDAVFVSDPPILVPSHYFDILFLNSRSRHNHFHELWGASTCGTDTYLITRRGAEKLVVLLQDHYLHLPIDMLILSQCVSMLKMGHHLSRFFNPDLPILTCYHDGPVTSLNTAHSSQLSH